MQSHDLSYRRCVGIMVLNRQGLVWAGHRAMALGNVAEGPESWWQMPQGGIDPHEDVERAALRELAEETSICSVSILAASSDWLTYDFPPEHVHRQRGTVYRGQRQKWIAVRFMGDDSEIDIAARPDELPEFKDWRWLRADELPKLVCPFKREVYARVVAEFAHWSMSGRRTPSRDVARS